MPYEKAIKECATKKCRKKILQRSVRRLVTKYIYYVMFLKHDFHGICWLFKICNLL